MLVLDHSVVDQQNPPQNLTLTACGCILEASLQPQELNEEQQSSDVESLIKIELQQPTLDLEAADDRQQLLTTLESDDVKQLEHQLGC
jgi:hypothetical protein